MKRPWAGLCGLAVLLAGGCTRESTRVAIETQRRADEVQQVVFDRQHEALCVLLYRDLLGRLESAAASLAPEQREALSGIWNDRDLIEFWALQNERARALRLAGVDAKLYSDQSIVDLLWKSLEARMDRARQGLAVRAAEEAAGGGN
jgi:hypothetical protein